MTMRGTNKIRCGAIGIAWVAMGIFDARFINADFRTEFHQLYQSSYHSKRARANSLGWGLLSGPFGFVITPFVTGFYGSGWTLSGEPFPCTMGTPEIWCKP